MSRYTVSQRCAEEGCGERGLFAADTRKEQTEIYARYRKAPWKCTRHRAPNEVVSADESAIHHTLVSYEDDFGADPTGRFYKLHRFWTTPDRLDSDRKGGSGFVYGPGFKAFADDFPTGTRLVITVHAELPDPSPATRDSEVTGS